MFLKTGRYPTRFPRGRGFRGRGRGFIPRGGRGRGFGGFLGIFFNIRKIL